MIIIISSICKNLFNKYKRKEKLIIEILVLGMVFFKYCNFCYLLCYNIGRRGLFITFYKLFINFIQY